MSLPAIEVSGLSKRYVIEHESRHDSLRDTLHHTARKLWRRARWGTGFETEEFWALRDVSFTVEPGEIVGVIGRNGAGKSTLLKILSRITEPTSGRVALRGRVASLLEVGTGFHPDLTGRENIFLNGAILGMSRLEIRSKFDEIVAFAEIEQFIDTPVKRYSSGMYVRLAFSVAAHLEPEILIVDEVLAVGDAQFQRKCIGKIKDVTRGSGRTVLLVSHNIATVANLCNRALWLERGQVRSFGSTDSASEAYLRQFSPEHSLAFDTSKSPRDPRHMAGVTITRVELNAGEPLVNRSPVSARIYFTTTRNVADVSFGIGFSTVDGTRLVSVDSDFHLERRSLPADCSGHVELRLASLDLGPGNYSLDAGARSGEATSLDYLSAFGIAEVHPATNAPAGFTFLGGGVRAPAQWNWVTS